MADDAGLAPLLEHAAEKEQDDWRRRRRQKPNWMVLLAAAAGLLLIVHVLFVALLLKTTVTLDRLTLPDLCHRTTAGEAVMEFQNPSYCLPDIGPLNVTFAKRGQAFLHVQIPGFELPSGVSTMVTAVNFRLLTTPEILHNLVFTGDDTVDVRGEVAVHISCMLIPFTIHLDVSNILRKKTQPPVDAFVPPQWRYSHGSSVDAVNPWGSSVINSIKVELQHVVTQILQTIALSHFHTERDDQEIFAYTDVSFQYASRVLWNIPSLSVEVQSAARQIILEAGFTRFLLGSGDTFISAYTELYKNQSDPLETMLKEYLTGNDVVLHVGGGNRDTTCYSLEVLDLIDVKVKLPAKIDGKPALLREYAISPTLKELDSKTHKCLLELKVVIKINNPLPIHFDLYGIELDLLYEKESNSGDQLSDRTKPTFLIHINDTDHVSWSAHEENSIVLDSAVHDFDKCMEVVDFYLHNKLTFDIQHGRITMGAGSGNFSIPFSAKGIHIHTGFGETESPSFVIAVTR